MKLNKTLAALCGFSLAMASAVAEEPVTASANDADHLAKQLQNPVAALISLPLQNNIDMGIGANDGWRYTLNVQPVVPFSLNNDWNLVSRTILPVIHQKDVVGKTTQSGLGDTVQSLFFSPKNPTSGGWILGAGPVMLLPTATDSLLGFEKWGVGPTAVALKQEGKLSYGVLANHIWSVAGESRRSDINLTFMQPFVGYAIGKGQAVSLGVESTYDWTIDRWTVPVSVGYGKVLKIGSQMVNVGCSFKYFAERPAGGPDWGFRVNITFLFPK